MCVQIRGRGVLSTVGRYHVHLGGIYWVSWGDIMSTVGVILSTMEDNQYHWVYYVRSILNKSGNWIIT